MLTACTKRNVAEGQKFDLSTAISADSGANVETVSEVVKDKIDDVDNVVAKGPKRADQYSGGRVQVGETGDLHDLAAKRQAEQA